MNTTAPWRAGVASDTGQQRANNEDRVYIDEAAGVFLVVDGVGGHAAGERAAEIAVKTIPEQLASLEGSPDERIRRAITVANNEIFELAQNEPECRGMACVLTLVVAHEDHVTVGHVGDSRLYLVWNGVLRKLTADHSPVGELEDLGKLTEAEAMQHPRRNEVFRDVGSRPREAHDEEFIEIKTIRFRPDAALLLCSDGLSDVLTAAQIGAVLQAYDGDCQAAARRLVDAANDAGGRDNISAVFVAGPEFHVGELQEFQPRHAITRKRRSAWWRRALSRAAWLFTGMILGMLFWANVDKLFPRPARSTLLAVNPADPLGIVRALAAAKPGDTVEIPAGEFLGPLQLKEGVTLVGKGKPAVRADDGGVALVARDLHSARVAGLRIVGDEAHPLRTGVLIANSALELDEVEITGARDSAVRIEGPAQAILRANQIHANPGDAILVTPGATAPHLAGNTIADNGKP